MTELEKLIINSKNHIILGTQYGDEGKGSITSKLIYLLSKQGNRSYLKNGINNYRFGGGMQVGHTTFDGKNYIENHAFPAGVHVILSYPHLNYMVSSVYNGSSSVYNGSTHINLVFEKNCVISFEKLYEDLLVYKTKYNFSKIRLNIHEDCVVSTFLDVYENRITNILNDHGTTGLGFGKTIERCENNPELKFTIKDFFSLSLTKLEFKNILLKIAKYYRIVIDDEFYDLLEKSYTIYDSIILDAPFDIKLFDNYGLTYYGYNIYEGHQGALLDKDSEDFPHVTRSKTTSRIPFDTIATKFSNMNLSNDVKNNLQNLCDDPIIYESSSVAYCSTLYSNSFLYHLVTRIYSTRHGNGPFIVDPIKLTNNSNESNKFNPYQLNFKTSKLNFKDLERGIYYIIRDLPYNEIFFLGKYKDVLKSKYDEFCKNRKFILHVTCCDQVDLEYFYDTISKISEMSIIKDNNIIIKTHETNNFHVF